MKTKLLWASRQPTCPHCGEEEGAWRDMLGWESDEVQTLECRSCGHQYQSRKVVRVSFESIDDRK